MFSFQYVEAERPAKNLSGQQLGLQSGGQGTRAGLEIYQFRRELQEGLLKNMERLEISNEISKISARAEKRLQYLDVKKSQSKSRKPRE